MKQLLLAALCALTLAGCASDYLIVTNDGNVLTSHGKPMLDKDTGMFEFEFEDEEGRVQQIPQSSVKSLIER